MRIKTVFVLCLFFGMRMFSQSFALNNQKMRVNPGPLYYSSINGDAPFKSKLKKAGIIIVPLGAAAAITGVVLYAGGIIKIAQ